MPEGYLYTIEDLINILKSSFKHFPVGDVHDMQIHVAEEWKFHHEFQIQDQIV